MVNTDIHIRLRLMARHAWLHYITDEPPTRGTYVEPKYQARFTENQTGTEKRYVPYSTTGPKTVEFRPAGPQNIEAERQARIE